MTDEEISKIHTDFINFLTPSHIKIIERFQASTSFDCFRGSKVFERCTCSICVGIASDLSRFSIEKAPLFIRSKSATL